MKEIIKKGEKPLRKKGYSTEVMIKMAVDAIKKNKLLFFSYLPAYIDVCNKTLHNHKLHDVQIIKDALALNRISAKHNALTKWEKSDNPVLQISFFKMIATETEREKLTMQKIETKTKKKEEPFDLNKLTTEELETFNTLINKAGISEA